MDYTEGALDIKASGIHGCVIKHLGPPVDNRAQFSTGHMRDLEMDSRCYALQLGPAQEMVAAVTHARPWVKNVYDCENRAFAFVNDIAEFARDNGYKFGVARAVLLYWIKSSGGYHAAPVFPIWTPEKKDLIPWIVEPKYLREGGAESPERWSRHEDEVLKWSLTVAPI